MKASHRTGFSILAIVLVLVMGILLVRGFVADVAVVEGRSMEPSLSSGDLVLVFRAAYGLRAGRGYLLAWSRPRARDIVAILRPGEFGAAIKRVSYVLFDSTVGYSVYVLGDNLYESVDSREFGTVPMNNILGKVVLLPRFRAR